MGRWKKLGIIAGGGALPARIAAAYSVRGDEFYLIRIQGSSDESLTGFPGADCGMGEAGRIIRTLKEQGCDAVVFAGAVRRPDFKTLRVDWRGASMLPKAIAAAAKGDGALLNLLVETVEAEDMIVIGAEEATQDLCVQEGPLGANAPTEQDFADIRKAAAVIQALGAFDIGQGAVVSNGHVLAVEAAEGTDAMLERCAKFPIDAEKGQRSGVLVKRPKPGQELRIDLPAIGPETVRRAARAGLNGIAVEAGVALIIDHEEAKKLADESDLFVYGFVHHEVGGQ